MYDTENKPRILVVEDEADIQQVICVFLKFSGFEVRSASNGQEAIRIIPEFRPQLIVLDLMMQPVSGWDVLGWLREKRITPTVPVLIMTALTQLHQQIHGFEEGAIEYITKPTQPSLLVERIRSILALSSEQQMMLRRKNIDEKRKALERVYAPQKDEFAY